MTITIMDMINNGDVSSMLFMGLIIVGVLAMAFFFNNELKKAHGEKKNDQSVGSAFSSVQQSGNSAVTAAISAAVNEYRKNK